MSIKFTIDASDFLRVVRKATKDTRREVSQETMRAGLRVEKHAKEIAPFDTGFLSMSIYASMVDEMKVDIISPAHYSVFQELGTRFMMAQPFIYPALDAERPRYFRNLAKIVGG